MEPKSFPTTRPLTAQEFRHYVELSAVESRRRLLPLMDYQTRGSWDRHSDRLWNRANAQAEGLQNAVLDILDSRAYVNEQFPSYQAFTRWIEARARQHDKRAKAREYGVLPPGDEGPFQSKRRPHFEQYDDGQQVEGGWKRTPEGEDPYSADIDAGLGADPSKPGVFTTPGTQADRLSKLDEIIEWHRARRRALKAQAYEVWASQPSSPHPHRESLRTYTTRQGLQQAFSQIGGKHIPIPVLPAGSVGRVPRELADLIERYNRHRIAVNFYKKLRKAVESQDAGAIERVIERAQATTRPLVLIIFEDKTRREGVLHLSSVPEATLIEKDTAFPLRWYTDKLARLQRERENYRDGKELGSNDGWRTPLRGLARPHVEPRPYKDDARDPERLPY